MVAHHVPDRASHMPAGIGVVADVADPLWHEVPRADGQDPVLDVVRYPGIDAVTDDVVKRPERVIDIEDAHVPQLDVGQTNCLNRLSPLGNLLVGEIDADEPAVRQAEG